GATVVARTGLYRGNRNVQLSADAFIVKVAPQVAIETVAIGFDDQPRAPRPLSKAEQELGALALEGGDFAKLTASQVLNVDVVTAATTRSHRIALRGIAGALDTITAACP